MPRNLDLALLRSFVTVAETGSMTGAANRLNLTQGAVSQQVKRLEEGLGGALFSRTNRRLRLTDAGERLVGKARQLLALNDAIWAEMTEPAAAGTVRLGVPYDLVGSFLPPILTAFARSHPQIDIALVCAASPDLEAGLAAGRVDLAVIEQPADSAAGECLGLERLVWVGCRGGAASTRRPLPLSVVSDSCAFRPLIFAALHRRGIDWRTVFENGNIEATHAMVRTDLAVTAALAATVPADLAILAAEDGLPDLPAMAIALHRAPAVSPAAQALARHIRDGFALRIRRPAA